MKKEYNLINSKFIIEADEKVQKIIEDNIVNIGSYMDKPYEYHIKYINNKSAYESIIKDYSLLSGEEIRFYGEEKKIRTIKNSKIFFLDRNSIIIHDNNEYTIIGNSEISIQHIIYLIRQAIYEGFLLDKKLILHSSAIENNNKATAFIGKPSAGKTTILLEALKKTNSNYITNDLLGIVDDKAIASIIPIRVAYGTLSRFEKQNEADFSAKKTYSVNQFLKEFNVGLSTNVNMKNLVYPSFGLDNKFNIRRINEKSAFDILKSQTLSICDPVRPYLWVNELDISLLKEIMEEKLYQLIKKNNNIEISYGTSIEESEMKEMKRALIMR